MLQDFNFKIVHRARTRHVYVDALSCNLIGSHDEDEDEEFLEWTYKMKKKVLVWHKSKNPPP
jgi:hypothetical protein